MEFVIQSKAEYDAALVSIREMMQRGEDKLSEAERSAFFRMAVAVERFENMALNSDLFDHLRVLVRSKSSS